MERMFPILEGAYAKSNGAMVPWAFVAPHERQALRNHDQTLERLAEGGGLGWSEVECVVLDKPWVILPRDKDRYVEFEAAAKARVEKLLAEWENAHKIGRLDTNPPAP